MSSVPCLVFPIVWPQISLFTAFPSKHSMIWHYTSPRSALFVYSSALHLPKKLVASFFLKNLYCFLMDTPDFLRQNCYFKCIFSLSFAKLLLLANCCLFFYCVLLSHFEFLRPGVNLAAINLVVYTRLDFSTESYSSTCFPD